MATHEIERRWLVLGFSDTTRYEARTKLNWYLYADDNVEIRLSCDLGPDNTLSNFKVTNKMGNGLDRIEVQYQISEAAFEEVRRNIDHPPIVKEWETYKMRDGRELCVSRVDNSWYYAEVEFDSVEEAQAFSAADMFPQDMARGLFVDVTGNNNYQMKNYWRRTRLGELPLT